MFISVKLQGESLGFAAFGSTCHWLWYKYSQLATLPITMSLKLELERYVYNKLILEACVLALSQDFSTLLPAWLLSLVQILLLI